MLRMECQAKVAQPEHPEATVREPQYLMYWLGQDQAIVEVYFMTNSAVEIEDLHAVAVGPDISLRYFTHSPSGAFTASLSIRKAIFRFSGLTQRSYQFSLKELKSNKSYMNSPTSSEE